MTTATAPAPLPFRVEMLGDERRLPYLVYHNGDPAAPFDPHTMRSVLVDANYREATVQLWGRLTAVEARVAELEAENARLLEAATAPAGE